MSEDITLSVQKRDVLGKKVKSLRSGGQTPAVIHQRGEGSLHVSVDSAALKKAYSSAGKHHAIKVDLSGKKYTTIIKEVVNAPASSIIQHAVLQAIKDDEKVTTDIPVKLIGEIPAEKASLLVLKSLDHISVEALPADLIDVVEVDASTLVEVGDRLHVSDIKLPSTITIKTEPEQVVATVEMPKDQVAEADAALEEQKAQDSMGEETAAGEAAEADKSESGEESEESSPEPQEKK